jgi:ribonucleoside-diphosphate reductase alpha chain
MECFGIVVSVSLQHGVPLQVLVGKLSHTRFEPSGWTGKEQLSYAKSIMDYLFRWMQLRFLSGTQLDLFAGLKPATAELGATSAALPGLSFRSAAEESASPEATPMFGDAPLTASNEPTSYAGAAAESLNDRRAPQQGIAPDIKASNGLSSGPYTLDPGPSPLKAADRGLYHAADAMKDMYDMGDAPSCSTCGSIMVRNGACHRCMECGSTSGCS